MSVTYAWPDWPVNRFEMRIMPNTRTFVGPYTPSVQTTDLAGERWKASLDLTDDVDPAAGGAREAFWDRLHGQSNTIAMWNLRRPVPNGTLRDGPACWVNNAGAAATWQNSTPAASTWYRRPIMLYAGAALNANTATLLAAPGQTLRAGDHLGINGQNIRIMVDAVADGAGLMSIEFQPRARAAWAALTTVYWNRPTANFMLAAEGVPTVWRVDHVEGTSVDLVEAP